MTTVASPRVESRVDGYACLKRLIAARGLLERRPSRSLLPAVGLVLMLAALGAGLRVSGGGWWALSLAAPAAILFGQVGFLAHDAAHNQVLRSSGRNYVLSLLLFNLCLGGGRGWWVDKHTIHHAQPNRLGVDPDIEGGVIATCEEQLVGTCGIARVVMRHQARAIAPLLSLGVLQIHIYSLGFLFRRGLRNAGAEAGLLLVHYVVYLGGLMVLLGVGRGLLFALLHQLLLGVYLGGSFLPNHIGMAVLRPGDQMDFLNRQVLTSRNIRGRAADVLLGGLSCQIEHHLFPAMPRCHLRKAAPIVRQFCRERGIVYRETGVIEAYLDVYRHLERVSRHLRWRQA